MDKVICVGKNYLKHAKELGDGINEDPIFFIKPPSTLLGVDSGVGSLELPRRFETHHEIELVLRVTEEDGNFHFSHYTFGLDLTLRDLQTTLKKSGQPWEKAKVFKNSAVVGSWQPLRSIDDVLDIPFELRVNGEVRQRGLGSDMRWKPLELLGDIRQWFPICDGDLVFTGTPEGVGPIHPGDTLEVSGGAVLYTLNCK